MVGFGVNTEDAIQDHESNLEALLKQCKEKALTFNSEKVWLQATEVPFIGHTTTDTTDMDMYSPWSLKH